MTASSSDALVSVIMPTRGPNARFIETAMSSILRQRYPVIELLILDDDDSPSLSSPPSDCRIRYWRSSTRLSVGQKRNLMCEAANGTFIVHADHDDYSGPDRIADQVTTLTLLEKHVLGYHDVLIWDETYRCAHRYNAENGAPLWAFAHGATFCYRKSWWRQFPFEDRTGKEDSFFAKAADKRSQFASAEAGSNIVLRAHPRNTYKPPLDRIAHVGGEEVVPSAFFDKL